MPALASPHSRNQARGAEMVETGWNALCIPMLGSSLDLRVIVQDHVQ
jgi:hypothetical protein